MVFTLFTSVAFALEKTDLDDKYKHHIGNFTTSNDGKVVSGISGGTVESLSSNKDAVGLVFTAKLGINTSGLSDTSGTDTTAIHWGRVVHNDDAFAIKVCINGTNRCFINTIPYTDERADTTKQSFSQTDIGGNPSDNQTLPVSVFSRNARNTGAIYSYDPTTGTAAAVNTVLSFPKGSNLTATFWYCAAGSGSQAAAEYRQNGITTENPTTFGNICGGFSYYQIGSALPVAIPADATELDQQTTDSQTTIAGGSVVSSSEGSNLPVCGIIVGEGTINGCIARIAYGIYVLVAWIAGILGNLFDFFLGYSVADTSYRYNFAVTGWKLVRDISNIFFIIIMVWTGFSAIFDTSKTGSMRKIVPALIINAILINFSLFATRVVIDISNITARMFYSQMVVCDNVNIDAEGKCDPAQAKRGPGGYWPLSEKIVSAFNPQQLFKTATLQPAPVGGAANEDSAEFDATKVGRSAGISDTDYANYFMVVCLVAALIMGFVGIMFFKVAFLFVGRVIGLYMCMIFSPFAFLSREMPMFGKFKQLKWEDWSSELVNYALLAPVFVFFLYIIYTFLSSDFAQEIGYSDPTGSFMGTALGVIIPMLIIYFLIGFAQKAAEGFSGSIGKSIQAYGEKLTGMAAGTALGLATGGAALLGRNVVGRGAQWLGERKTGRQIEVDGKMVDETRAMNIASRSATSWTARQQNRLLRATQTGDFNIGNAGVKIGGKDFKLNNTINRGLGAFGIKSNNLLSNAAYVGDNAGKGGILAVDKKRVEERQKELEDRIKFDHLSDDQAKAAWEAHKQDAVRKDAEKRWRDNDNIDQEEGVKQTAKKMKDLLAEEETLKKEKADLETRLAAAQKSGDTAGAATLSSTKAERERALAENQRQKGNIGGTLKTLREEKIKELEESGRYISSEAFKNVEKAEAERLSKYGKIKNGKQLTAAMRAEYGEDLRKGSFWLKDGKPRYDNAIAGTIGAAATTALDLMLPGIGTAVGTLIAQNMAAGSINNRVGDINSKATKAMMDSFKKTQGKGNKEARLSAEIDALNAQIKEAADAHFPAGQGPKGSVDDWSSDQIDSAVAGKSYILRQEIEALRAQARSATSEAEKRDKSIQAELKAKQIEKLNKAAEEKRRIQNELDKVKAAADNAKKDDSK